ncbi:uncharacterized protein LOC131998009 [Stomoxys calcitrans]|uniref:uncharacterized protein LOC131998009 n=1 Tax=Stomoxys calcitrans TaxID=35570 RepID=UPI0027E392F8|nr:uncharacterized protein LOC131998009 [Stomoxys calcitrans]
MGRGSLPTPIVKKEGQKKLKSTSLWMDKYSGFLVLLATVPDKIQWSPRVLWSWWQPLRPIGSLLGSRLSVRPSSLWGFLMCCFLSTVRSTLADGQGNILYYPLPNLTMSSCLGYSIEPNQRKKLFFNKNKSVYGQRNFLDYLMDTGVCDSV